MSDSGPSTMRKQLGAELRRLREAAGITGTDAGAAAGMSQSWVSRVERGQQVPPVDLLRDLLDAYGVPDGVQQDLIELRHQADRQDWWAAFGRAAVPELARPLLSAEPDATEIRCYSIDVVPGLLQTLDYARAVLWPDADVYGLKEADVERQARVRMERRKILTRIDPEPVRLHTVIFEAALRQPLGGPKVFGDQLRHLLEMAERPNITIQVLPFGLASRPVMSGPFSVLVFPSGAVAAHVSGQNIAAYLEDKADVRPYTVMYDRLLRAGLGVPESRALIAEAADRYQ